jgi:hypothetical protein
MGTTKKRHSKRNTNTSSVSRQQAALSFLTNISLGNEQVTLTTSPVQKHFVESKSHAKLTRYGTLPVIPPPNGLVVVEAQEDALLTDQPVRQRRRSSTLSSYRHRSHSDSSSSTEVHQYKLTREDDSKRPIASEKVKKKLSIDDNNNVLVLFKRGLLQKLN